MEQVTGESAAAYWENEPESSPDQLTVILIIPCCSFLSKNIQSWFVLCTIEMNHCPQKSPTNETVGRKASQGSGDRISGVWATVLYVLTFQTETLPLIDVEYEFKKKKYKVMNNK